MAIRMSADCSGTGYTDKHPRHLLCDTRTFTSWLESVPNTCQCPCHEGERRRQRGDDPLTEAERAERLYRV